jgi:AmiR/NasT family two-component response regulator
MCEHFRRLREELTAAKRKPSERKLVERARDFS